MDAVTLDPTAEAIARLNDQARRGDPAANGRIMLTAGVVAHLDGDLLKQIALLRTVATFDKFSDDNNPHGERDYGSFLFDGETILWKIDYYALNDFEHGSEDPADVAQTTRVLTIMLRSEY